MISFEWLLTVISLLIKKNEFDVWRGFVQNKLNLLTDMSVLNKHRQQFANLCQQASKTLKPHVCRQMINQFSESSPRDLTYFSWMLFKYRQMIYLISLKPRYNDTFLYGRIKMSDVALTLKWMTSGYGWYFAKSWSKRFIQESG